MPSPYESKISKRYRWPVQTVIACVCSVAVSVYGPPADPSTQFSGASSSRVTFHVVSPGQLSVIMPTMSVWSQTHSTVGASVVVGPGYGSGVGEAEGASVSVGARVPKQSRNAKASTLPAPSFPSKPEFSPSIFVAVE